MRGPVFRRSGAAQQTEEFGVGVDVWHAAHVQDVAALSRELVLAHLLPVVDEPLCASRYEEVRVQNVLSG